MYKLLATIKKDVRVLLRDKVGLTFMFLMPIMLAIIITAVQNSTFELVNDNKITLLICNRDKGEPSTQLLAAINKIGMFEVKQVSAEESDENFSCSFICCRPFLISCWSSLVKQFFITRSRKKGTFASSAPGVEVAGNNASVIPSIKWNSSSEKKPALNSLPLVLQEDRNSLRMVGKLL